MSTRPDHLPFLDVARPPRGGRQRVPSVDRAVQILNLLAAEPRSLGLAAISTRLGFPRSSTLALCNSLVASRLVTRDEATGVYRLGPHVLALSRAFLRQTDVLREFQRARVAAELQQWNLLLAVLDGSEGIYLDRRPGLYPVGVVYEPGTRLPANCTASGKALLSGLAADEIRAIFASNLRDLPALTPRSITDVEVLIEHVAEAVKRGYTIDDDETAQGMLCVGAPVRGADGKIVCAVSATMLKAEISAYDVAKYGAEIQRFADRIAAGLGYPDPPAS